MVAAAAVNPAPRLAGFHKLFADDAQGIGALLQVPCAPRARIPHTLFVFATRTASTMLSLLRFFAFHSLALSRVAVA